MLQRYLAVALAAFAATIRAQDTTKTSEDEPTKTEESEGPATHTIKVGFPGFDFTPNTTMAEVGDFIAFKFYPPDHSVIRANFEHGCIPYERVGKDSVGFYTGQFFLNGISDDGPVVTYRVNDTEPIFFYCGAKNSCKGKHMIGVVNPNATWTLDEHLKRVEEAEFELTPDDDWPTEQEKPDDYNEDFKEPSGAASEDKPSSSDGSQDNSDASDDKDSGSGNHLSPGAIAGIAIGSAAVLILAGGLVYLCGRRGGFDKAYRKSATPSNFNPNMGSFNGGPVVTPNMMMEQKTLSPKLQEAWGGGPQTPGPVAGYAAVPNNEGTYRDGSPQLNGGFGPRSPPLSPNQGYGGYSGTMVSAMTGSDGAPYGNATMAPHTTPPPNVEAGGAPAPAAPAPSQSPPKPAPVELPASADPGNSPLPSYPARQFSWAQGSETSYRPGKT